MVARRSTSTKIILNTKCKTSSERHCFFVFMRYVFFGGLFILLVCCEASLACVASLVPLRLCLESSGRMPIDVMETLELLRMIHVCAVQPSSPT